jgi:hypothetical protein
VFESSDKLVGEIGRLLAVVRELAASHYACVIDAESTLFESPDQPPSDLEPLRGFLASRRRELLALPERLASGEPLEDLFAEWDHDGFFLATVNGRVGLIAACPDAAAAEERVRRPLRVLADRLLRWNPAYRIDQRGFGFLFGRPRLETLVVERPGAR